MRTVLLARGNFSFGVRRPRLVSFAADIESITDNPIRMQGSLEENRKISRRLCAYYRLISSVYTGCRYPAVLLKLADFASVNLDGEPLRKAQFSDNLLS